MRASVWRKVLSSLRLSQRTEQQAASLASMASSVAQLDDVTQQNAALVEQASAAAASLRQQTGRVSSTIAGFL